MIFVSKCCDGLILGKPMAWTPSDLEEHMRREGIHSDRSLKTFRKADKNQYLFKHLETDRLDFQSGKLICGFSLKEKQTRDCSGHLKPVRRCMSPDPIQHRGRSREVYNTMRINQK